MRWRLPWRNIFGAFLLSALLVLSMVSYAAAAEVKSSDLRAVSASHPTKTTPQESYNNGFTNGYQDAQAECSKNLPEYMHPRHDTWPNYMNGYQDGFSKGYDCNGGQVQKTSQKPGSNWDDGNAAGIEDGKYECSHGEPKADVPSDSKTYLPTYYAGYKHGLTQGYSTC